jgi:hypothetical protein
VGIIINEKVTIEQKQQCETGDWFRSRNRWNTLERNREPINFRREILQRIPELQFAFGLAPVSLGLAAASLEQIVAED